MCVCVFILCVVQEIVCIQCGEWYTLASSPGSFPLSTHERKEPGNIGGFKLLTSAGSDRAPPNRLQDEIMGMHDFLKVLQTRYPDKDKQVI